MSEELTPYINSETKNLDDSDFTNFNPKKAEQYEGPKGAERKDAVAKVFKSITEVGFVGNQTDSESQRFKWAQSQAGDVIETAQEENEKREAVVALATIFHEEWRKTRKNEDGSYEPRIKSTSDEIWIQSHDGATEVDIANTGFGDLPSDWKAENAAAAEVVVTEISSRTESQITDDKIEEMSAVVHDEWLERNAWAKGGDLDVPYADLPEDEKAKDRDQVLSGVALFEGKI